MALPDVSRQFLSDSRTFLTHDYLPKIERCMSQLTPEQIWFRANDASNSIGNLLLHLAGSSRYWAIEVIGGPWDASGSRSSTGENRWPRIACWAISGRPLRTSIDGWRSFRRRRS